MEIPTIVLVDDDADDREFFEFACGEIDAQIQLESFCHGKPLFESLEHNVQLPDIIFLDINMPGMDGFECLDSIRNTKKLEDICVIMYSTSRNNSEINKCYRLGANGFVQKPHSLDELKTVLGKIFDTDWKNPCNKLDELNFVLGINNLKREKKI